MKGFEGDARVTDMNLEARLEKELLLHGFRRRDFTEEQIQQLRDELDALKDGNCSLLEGFWEEYGIMEKPHNNPYSEPEPIFAIGQRVWVTGDVAVNGIPGVGYVRSVEKEWIDLGEELQGYWEITYQLRNMRTPISEEQVFATELEALAAIAADFRKQAVAQAAEVCKQLRAIGMDISTKELLTNIADSI